MRLQDPVLLMSRKSNLSHFCLGCLMPCQGETRSQDLCTEQNISRALLTHGPRVLAEVLTGQVQKLLLYASLGHRELLELGAQT